MNKQSFSKKLDAKHLSTANKAFANLPPDQEESSRNQRIVLYEWLERMEECRTKPAMVIDRAMGWHAFDTLTAYLKEQPKFKTLYDALVGLADEEGPALFQSVVMEVLSKFVKTGALLSRSNDGQMWENTGFLVDKSTKTVFAKAGKSPYEPIGFDDESRYIGTTGSKTLWWREWAMALLIPWQPAFMVAVDEKVEVSDARALSEQESINAKEVIEWFDTLLAKAAGIVDPEPLKVVHAEIRDTISLARVRCPRLDIQLTQVAQEAPEMGQNLEQFEPIQLLSLCREFVAMILEDTMVAKKIVGTTLTLPVIDDPKSVVNLLRQQLATAIEHKESDEDLSNLISRVVVILGSDASLAIFGSDPNHKYAVSEAARRTLEYLNKQTETK